MNKKKEFIKREDLKKDKKRNSDSEDIIDVLLEEDWKIVRNLDLPRQNKRRKITGRR